MAVEKKTNGKRFVANFVYIYQISSKSKWGTHIDTGKKERQICLRTDGVESLIEGMLDTDTMN